ncbi:MAG: hypothetical protein LC114_13855 [Bryobacterales bacterium]|nr:hypothetical protein [Bryobacterales bacterium]
MGRVPRNFRCLIACVLLLSLSLTAQPQEEVLFSRAQANGRDFDAALSSTKRLLHAWLADADAGTLLLPDRIPGRSHGLKAGDTSRLYTPHNSGADLYPYLVLTANLTDRNLYSGRLLEMLRNELRYTTVQESIPANLEMTTGELGPPSLFGAGEYAKDGLLAITEYLGRTPWYYRMVDLIADAMARAPVDSRFGKLPASDAELNGDFLQALVRLETMTNDRRFVEWSRRIASAYFEEVLPGNGGVPSGKWDFASHTGDGQLRLRDHGNETVVGLILQFALENYWQTPYAEKWRTPAAKMLDRILASTNPDGMLYNQVNAQTLEPVNQGLSDNWGYVYGAVYTFYQSTGEVKYRDAVRRVLRNLPKYRNWKWEPNPQLPLGSFDGYADAIESAIYLVNREPVPEALEWIDSEMKVMMNMQQPDGHIENWYGEGNYNRTTLLWALMKSQGVRPRQWEPGVRLGGVVEGQKVYLSLAAPKAITLQFDSARHRRVLNLDKNYVRLNEFPEWFTVDENTLYRVRAAGATTEQILLGSELIEGVALAPGNWIVESAGPPPYAHRKL